MSAMAYPIDWRIHRALAALMNAHGRDIDIVFYAQEFELDEDSTCEIFEDAADRLGYQFLCEDIERVVLH